jgi:hypothetical protein
LHCGSTALQTQALPDDDHVVNLLNSLSKTGSNTASATAIDTAPQEYIGHAHTATHSIRHYNDNADGTRALHGVQDSDDLHDAGDIDDVDATTGYTNHHQVRITYTLMQ